MDSILKQINRSNYRERDDNLYISKLLFCLVSDITDISAFQSKEIDGVEFIEIGSIPIEIRHKYGLYRIKAIRKSKQEEEGIEKPSSLSKRQLESNKKLIIEEYVLQAAVEWQKLKHEFIDYFIDADIIKSKSITLSILNLLRSYAGSVNDMKLIHQASKINCRQPCANFGKN